MTDIIPPDWIAIELDYRAGIKTLRVIAGEHGITEGAIRKRAKKEDWERDLAAKIAAKTESIVRKSAVREEVRKEGAAYENAVVMANAEMRAATLMRHRRDFQRLQDMCEALTDELATQSICKQEIARLAEIVSMASDGDQESADFAMKTISKTLGLANRADTFKKLIDAKKSITALEREVLGMDEKTKDKGEPTTYNMSF